MQMVQGAEYTSLWRAYRTKSVYKVVFQKSMLAQIRRLILYIIHREGNVDGFVRELIYDNFTNTVR